MNKRLKPRNLACSVLFLAACAREPRPDPTPPACPTKQTTTLHSKPEWWDRLCPGIPFHPDQQLVLPPSYPDADPSRDPMKAAGGTSTHRYISN